MDVTDLRDRTALVTGAGSGIGRATALALAARGADLVVCDNDEGRLEAIARELRDRKRLTLARRVDVADADAVAELAAAVHGEVEAVDLLVNNAGVGLGARFLDTSLEHWDWILGINLRGVIHGCHFFIPQMVRRGRGGHVVNIASSAAFVSTSGLCAYSVTKFGVRALSEALREELHEHRIGVTAVCPGIINTNIVRSMRTAGPMATEAARERAVRAFERRDYPPARVARNILKAVQRNRAVAPIAPEAWAFYYGKRFLPSLTARLVRWMGRRERARTAAEPPAPSGSA